jgi:hypothetical protein
MNTEVIESAGPFALLWSDHSLHSEGNPANGIEGTEVTYQYEIFLPRCETYAIRLVGPHVTGVYGPLEYDEVLFSALPSFPYEDRADIVDWVESNSSDFAHCDTEYREGMIWI